MVFQYKGRKQSTMDAKNNLKAYSDMIRLMKVIRDLEKDNPRLMENVLGKSILLEVKRILNILK